MLSFLIPLNAFDILFVVHSAHLSQSVQRPYFFEDVELFISCNRDQNGMNLNFRWNINNDKDKEENVSIEIKGFSHNLIVVFIAKYSSKGIYHLGQK